MLSHAVTLFEVDIFGRMRPSYLLRFVLQSCENQLETEGSAARIADGLRNRTGWMLARLVLEQNAPVHEGDLLEFHCSFRQQSGAAYLREMQILSDNIQVASCRMLWMLVDLDDRRILRPKELEPLFVGIPSAEGIASVPRTVLPKNIQFFGKHQVLYSECDKNGHYSSPNYIDLLCDSFDFWKDSNNCFKSLQIDYHSEFLPGENIELHSITENGYVAVQGQHMDGSVGFSAIFRTGKILS